MQEITKEMNDKINTLAAGVKIGDLFVQVQRHYWDNEVIARVSRMEDTAHVVSFRKSTLDELSKLLDFAQAMRDVRFAVNEAADCAADLSRETKHTPITLD